MNCIRKWLMSAFLLTLTLYLIVGSETVQAADLSILAEAKALAQNRALYPPNPSLDDILDVRAYLKAIDPYSNYISPEERRFLEDTDKPDYSGIGMDVIAGTDGNIFCIPFDSSPAHAAGVRSGDRLMALDGQIVTAKSFELLPALVRGLAGSPVAVRIAKPDGTEHELIVNRAAVHRSVVEASRYADVLKIRIYRFEAETPGLLRQALSSAPKQKKIIIDLRGNIGGELKAAVESIGLFLPPDTLIAKVLGRPSAGLKPVYHKSQAGDKFLGRQIVIWQDHMTASSSEVFISALIDNKQAKNIGRHTFGKSLVQEVFLASNGGFFIITTGEIIPPSGHSFNKNGIAPYSMIEQYGDDPNDVEFLRQAEKFFASSKLIVF